MKPKYVKCPRCNALVNITYYIDGAICERCHYVVLLCELVEDDS